MPRPLLANAQIIVVDPSPQDYDGLPQLANKHTWQLHFLTSGRTAIRFANRAVDLWMINVSLPDMSGLELVEMLRDRARGTRVFVIADQYTPDDERRACRCGADLYLCKDASKSISCEPLLEQLAAGKCANLPPPQLTEIVQTAPSEALPQAHASAAWSR